MGNRDVCQPVEYSYQCALTWRGFDCSLLFFGGRRFAGGRRARAVCQETASEGGYESDEQDLPLSISRGRLLVIFMRGAYQC